jgi:hypothetical protein
VYIRCWNCGQDLETPTVDLSGKIELISEAIYAELQASGDGSDMDVEYISKVIFLTLKGSRI